MTIEELILALQGSKGPTPKAYHSAAEHLLRIAGEAVLPGTFTAGVPMPCICTPRTGWQLGLDFEILGAMWPQNGRKLQSDPASGLVHSHVPSRRELAVNTFHYCHPAKTLRVSRLSWSSALSSQCWASSHSAPEHCMW